MLRCSNIIWCVLLSREVRPQVMAAANSSLGVVHTVHTTHSLIMSLTYSLTHSLLLLEC